METGTLRGWGKIIITMRVMSKEILAKGICIQSV